jgi:hypothetical protein
MKRGFDLTPEEVNVIAGTAKWMHAAALFYFAAGALVIAGGFVLLLGSGPLVIPIAATAAVVVIACGMWLRRAADAFGRGAAGSEETALGLGFRRLRAYFILTGLLGILQLVFQFVRMMA